MIILFSLINFTFRYFTSYDNFTNSPTFSAHAHKRHSIQSSIQDVCRTNPVYVLSSFEFPIA